VVQKRCCIDRKKTKSLPTFSLSLSQVDLFRISIGFPTALVIYVGNELQKMLFYGGAAPPHGSWGHKVQSMTDFLVEGSPLRTIGVALTVVLVFVMVKI